MITTCLIILLILLLIFILFYDKKENFVDMYAFSQNTPQNVIYVEGEWPYQVWTNPMDMFNYMSPSTRNESYDIRDYGLYRQL